MMTQRPTLALTAFALAALALAGCDRHDTATARTDGDTHVAQAGPNDAPVTSGRDASERARAAGRNLGEAGRDAADATVDAVGDAAITTSINAKLAKDPKLSALDVNVDTSGGNVVLHGSAPDAAAKARATELAREVHGVRSVDNELTVTPQRP